MAFQIALSQHNVKYLIFLIKSFAAYLLLAGCHFNHVYCTIKIPQVPGLRKSSNIRSHMVTKLKPLIPAKVSGLSKKLSPVQKRKDCDTENKVGLQSTIGELWKSFQFKRWVTLTLYLVHSMVFFPKETIFKVDSTHVLHTIQ